MMLERLVSQFFAGTPPERVKNYVIKLASSRVGVPRINENDIKSDSIAGLSPDQASKYQKLFFRLIKLKAITKRAQILYILNKVKNFSTDSVSFPVVPGIPPKPQNQKSSVALNTKQKLLILLEKDIISDLFKILGQNPGFYYKKSEENEDYVLENAVVMAPFGQMVDEILELSKFELKLKKFIESQHLSETESLLSRCLKIELDLYSDFIMKLIESKPNNLRKIHYWCKEPLEKMTLLAVIVESIEGLKGGQILSVIYKLSAQGNTQIKSLMETFLFYTSENIVKMIHNWCNSGEIEDKYSEFFISEDLQVDVNSLWYKKYQLRPDMVPCFFTEQLVNSILKIGKNINFIKLACGEPWFFSNTSKLPQINDIESFHSWSNSLETITGQHLLSLISIKYNLDQHFSCLKKYILLTQGDFSQSLLSKTFELLSKNANSIFRHETNTILEFAIRDSNAKFENLDCLSRLDTKLLEPSPLDTGWDVFILDYIFSPPLTTIFSQSSMEIYLRAFKFLWQIKRAHYLCNLYSHPRDSIIYQSYYELKQVFHNFQLLKHELTHFVNNLMSYMLVEVVEGSWKVFNKKMGDAKGLDELIKLHEMFLVDIEEKSFLGDEEMYRRVLSIVDICGRFFSMQEELSKAAEEERVRREVELTHGSLEELRVFDEMICDVGLLKEQFLDEFSEFRKRLGEQSSIFQRFLAFRLDFNEFYELKQLEFKD